MNTLYNVCPVHQGIFSTSGGGGKGEGGRGEGGGGGGGGKGGGGGGKGGGGKGGRGEGGDIMNTLGMFNTLGDIMIHDACGGIS